MVKKIAFLALGLIVAQAVAQTTLQTPSEGRMVCSAFLTQLQDAFNVLSKSTRSLCDAMHETDQVEIYGTAVDQKQAHNSLILTTQEYQKAKKNLKDVGTKLGLDLSISSCLDDTFVAGTLAKFGHE